MKPTRLLILAAWSLLSPSLTLADDEAISPSPKPSKASDGVFVTKPYLQIGRSPSPQ